MAQGVEIASAYVSLIPSAAGIGDAIAKELGAPVAKAAQDAGADAGKRISDGLLSGTKDTGKKLITALGLAAVGAIAVKSAIDVEDAQNTIIRTTGATGKAAEGLEASFRNVASGTAASFETVSTTLSQLYQRTGLQGKALEGLTSQVVSFNRQFKDSPITVDALTKSLAGFNVPGKEMGTVLDHLFIISQKTGVPLSELLGTLQTAGPIARQFGLSVEDTATLLANLNKAGVDANQILPGLKKVFKDAADAGKDPQEALRGIVGQIQSLVKAGDEIGARNLAVQVFGAKGVGLVDAIISGKLSLEDFNKSISVTGDGILDTGKKTGTLAGALGVLRNNVQLALASFATPGLEAANELLRSVLPTIKDLGQEFATLPDFVKVGLVAVVGLGFGVGKIGEFSTNALPGIIQLGRAIPTAFSAGADAIAGATSLLQSFTLAELAAAAAPFAIVVGVAALAVGLGELVGHDRGSFGAITDELEKGEAQGKRWAQTIIASAHATTTPIASLRESLRNVRDDTIAYVRAVQSGNVEGDINDIANAYGRYKTQVAGIKAEIAKVKQEQKDEAAQARETAASLDQYTRSTEAGTNASSALSHLTDDAKKALADLQSALLQAAGGEIGYQQALISRQEAQDTAQGTFLAVLAAQKGLNDAVALFGPDSEAARIAQEALTKAQRDNTSAQLDLKQAQLNTAQATLALTDNEQKLLDTISGGDATREQQLTAIDGEIAKLQASQREYPATADSINPLIFQLIVLKSKIEEVPPEKEIHITVPGLFESFQQLVDFKNVLDTIASDPALQQAGADPLGFLAPHAAGGIFTKPHIGLFAEAGPEAILPLSNPSRSLQILQQTGLAGIAPKGDNPLDRATINYYGPLDDPAARTRAIFSDLRNAAVLVGL